MARTVVEFLGSLRAAVPLSKAADWDVVGLQVGDQSAAAERVAVTHEVTDAVLDELDNEDIDLLIAYHPLMLRRVNRILAGHGAVGRAYRLVRMGVSLAVVHTAFDIVPGGAADALASALGLSDPTGFGPLWPAGTVKVVAFAPEPDIDRLVTAMAEAGAGGIGSYSACSFRSQGTGTFLAPEAATPAVGRAGVFNHEPEVRVEMVAPKSHADRVVAALVAAHRYEEPAYDVVDVRSNAGFVGRLGRLETPVTLQTFAHRVGERLDAPVRVAGQPEADHHHGCGCTRLGVGLRRRRRRFSRCHRDRRHDPPSRS